MSTRYNTQNPIESDDVMDMSDNAKNLDIFSNSSELSFDDRLGIERKTIHGMNSEFDAQILNMGFTRVGTFLSGATLTNPRQTLLWGIADGGDGQEYGWSGTFPKIVPPGSTPSSTGGIAVGSWMSRFDPELKVQVRESLRRSYAEAGYNLVAGSFEAGGTLVNANDVLLQERTGKGYTGPAGTVAAGTNPASGGFVDKSGLATSASAISNANGGSVQDFIDAQNTTVAELATGKFQVGQYVRLTDRVMGLFLVKSGGIADGKGVLDAGGGNTAEVQICDYLDLLWLGAKLDGITPEHEHLSYALNKIKGRIYINPNKAGLLSSGLTSVETGDFEIFGGGKIIQSSSVPAGTVALAIGVRNGETHAENITVRDITFFRQSRAAYTSVSDAFQSDHFISFYPCKNVLVQNSRFIGFQGDGISIARGAAHVASTAISDNIVIDSCLFDGVDKRNRNGISVIAGKNIKITNNHFTRCSDKNYMPGAIDIEPNPWAGDVVDTVLIRGNTIESTKTATGAITIVILPEPTQEVRNITITDNTFKSDSLVAELADSVYVWARSTSFKDSNILISNNIFQDQRKFVNVYGSMRGLTITGNVGSHTENMILGFEVSHTVKDVIVSQNTITKTGGSVSSCVLLKNFDNVNISNNIIKSANPTSYMILVGGDLQSARLAVINNTIIGVGTTSETIRDNTNGARIDLSTCTYMQNITNLSAIYFGAFKSDIGCKQYKSFTGTTPLTSFPFGESRATIVGSSTDGVPNLGGGYQGTLVVVRPYQTDTVADQKYAYRLWYPANNTIDLGVFCFSKWDYLTQQWLGWQKFTGTAV